MSVKKIAGCTKAEIFKCLNEEVVKLPIALLSYHHFFPQSDMIRTVSLGFVYRCTAVSGCSGRLHTTVARGNTPPTASRKIGVRPPHQRPQGPVPWAPRGPRDTGLATTQALRVAKRHLLLERNLTSLLCHLYFLNLTAEAAH